MDRATAKSDYDMHVDTATGKTGDRDPAFDDSRTNLDRALNGRDCCALACTGSMYLAFEDYETGLEDALTNLMHFARRYEIDFDEALSSARRHHRAEQSTSWDEVPTA